MFRFRSSTAFSIPLTFIALLFLSGCGGGLDQEPDIRRISDARAGEAAEAARGELSLTLADSLEIDLWASKELIEDPIGLDIDDHGKAYLTVTRRSGTSEFDIRGHRDWMIRSISWRSVQDRKDFLHEELAPSRSEQNTDIVDDFNGDGSHDWRDLAVQEEEIWTVEDTTGDGRADRSQLYIKDFGNEETDVAGSVLAHNSDVYVAVAPDMWRTRDTDGDGMADEKTSISTGYMAHIGFGGHGMSGAMMGPDGRVYWGIGDIGLNVKGPDGRQWSYPNQGAILRSDPDGSNFEVFAAGVRNTHEFTFDKYGNLISVDNDGDHAGEHERLVYLVNGSDSGWRINWQFGKYVDPKNNQYKVWMDEEYFKPRWEGQAAHILPPVAPYHSGPAGMVYNPGTALSDRWDDHFFVSEFVGSPTRSAIHAFSLEPKGAGFELKTDQQIVEGVLGTGLDFGPDGSLYIADWIMGWDTNKEGRIWRVDYPSERNSAKRKDTKERLAEDFTPHSADRLSQLLEHEDMRVRLKAQYELADRGDEAPFVEAVAQTDHQLKRVHGIWGIAQMGRENPELAKELLPYLTDSDAEIRAQAAKMLGNVRYRPAAEQLIPLLSDEAPRVRFFATEALGRMEYEPAIAPIVEMLEANNDEDIYLRHGGAIALARIGDDSALGSLSDHSSEAVRIAAVVALRRLESPMVEKFLDDESEYIVTDAARAINDDSFIEESIPALAKLLDEPRFTNEPLLRRAINASTYSGTSADATRLAAFAQNTGVSEALRMEAIEALAVWAEPSVLDRVTGRYRGEITNEREDAVNAIATLVDPLLESDSPVLRSTLAEAIGALGHESAAERLRVLVESDPSPQVKISALNALVSLEYPAIDAAIETVLASDQPEVRMEALSLIPTLDMLDKEQVVELLASVLEDGAGYEEQQTAVTALGEIDSEAAGEVLADQLNRLIEGSFPREAQLELLQAAEQSGSERVQSLLEQYQASKPEGDLVAQYRELLYGGTAQQGAMVFYRNDAAQCIRCHAINSNGGDVGPRLNTIGETLDREELLLSLIDPNARIAPGYGSVAVTLENGDNVQGVLKEETESTLVLQSADGELHRLDRNRIAERSDSPSAMYSMRDILTRSQIRDLVEYLSQQR